MVKENKKEKIIEEKSKEENKLKEALFWKELKNKIVQCQLCPRFCVINSNEKGFCRARKNIDGKLYSLVYGKVCSINIDPIEKKPLFMFAPSTKCLSFATVGCNLACQFCQNWEISQAQEVFGEDMLPNEIVNTLDEINKKSSKKEKIAQGVAYTYTEPTIMFEFAYETMKIAFKKGYYNVWVSNGYTNEEPIKLMAKYLHAINVDYKGDEKFYKNICNASLEPVQNSLKLYKKLGIWIEITNLVIPGYNDSKDVILEMVRWIRENLGRETPLHFSAYYPAYKMHVMPTPVETLEKAAKIAEDYLDYVYIGNVRHEKENTYCPRCKELLIRRFGFFVEEINIERKGLRFFCPNCKKRIPIKGARWMQQK
ncbi:MAG: AmmeMemoRadiSam system radical SAM enzyme [Candidatus Aenigmatarchaeota archaeon]